MNINKIEFRNRANDQFMVRYDESKQLWSLYFLGRGELFRHMDDFMDVGDAITHVNHVSYESLWH